MTHAHDAAALDARHLVTEAAASLLDNAPWWLISAGIHVVLILAAGLVYMERALAVEEGIVVQISAGSRQIVLPPEPPPQEQYKGSGLVDTSVDPSAEAFKDPVIFNPYAEKGDHNESDDGEDYGQMKGDSMKYLSYIRGEGGGPRGRQAGLTPGWNDALGVGGGGGGGGRHGGPFGGRRNMVVGGPGGNGPRGVDAVLRGLRWLARHQSDDGRWDGDGFGAKCGAIIAGSCKGNGDPEHDVGLTGLSLLAFLGAGFTHLSGDVHDGIAFGKVVKKGLQWTIAVQDADGCVGGQAGSKYMYDHAIAALALSEAYGMTGSEYLRVPAQKAINFLVAAQNPYKGWRYTARCGDNDTSVTGWCIMALKSAEISSLAVPRGGFEGTRAWLDEVTTPDFRVGYNEKDTGKVVVPGKNEQFDHHETLAAIAIMSRIFIDRNRHDPRLKGAADLLVKDLPAWDGVKTDFYYWYYVSLALFQYDGPSGPYWLSWNEKMKHALLPNQKPEREGCASGSWDAVDRWSFSGGRVYATAINTLTLEVYYRYDTVFGGGGGKGSKESGQAPPKGS